MKSTRRRAGIVKRAPNPELGLAIVRVVTGVIFVAHGAPKLFGGVGGTAGFLDQLGVPIAGFFAWVVTLLEFFGGIALILGLLVVPVALLLSAHMLTGIILVHAKNGFYVIGPGQGGVEFNLLLIASLLLMVFAGPGMAALDSRGEGSEPVTSAGPGGPPEPERPGSEMPDTGAGGPGDVGPEGGAESAPGSAEAP